MVALEFRLEFDWGSCWSAGWSLVCGRVGVPAGGWLVVALEFRLEVGCWSRRSPGWRSVGVPVGDWLGVDLTGHASQARRGFAA